MGFDYVQSAKLHKFGKKILYTNEDYDIKCRVCGERYGAHYDEMCPRDKNGGYYAGRNIR